MDMESRQRGSIAQTDRAAVSYSAPHLHVSASRTLLTSDSMSRAAASGSLKAQHTFWRCASYKNHDSDGTQIGTQIAGTLIGRSWSSVVHYYTGVDISPNASNKASSDASDATLTAEHSIKYLEGHHDEHGPQFAAVLDSSRMDPKLKLSDQDLRQLAEERDVAFKHRATNRRQTDQRNVHNFAVDIGNHASSVGHTVYAPNFFIICLDAESDIMMTKETLLDPKLKARACAQGEAGFSSPQVPTMREKGTQFMSEAPRSCAIVTRIVKAAEKLHASIAPEAASQADNASSKYSYLKNGVDPIDQHLERFNITVNFNTMRGYGNGEEEEEEEDDDLPPQRTTRNSNNGVAPIADDLPPSNVMKSMQGKEYYERLMDSDVPYRLVNELPPDCVAASKAHCDLNDLHAGLLITGALCSEPHRLAGGETFLEVDSLTGKITPSPLWGKPCSRLWLPGSGSRLPGSRSQLPAPGSRSLTYIRSLFPLSLCVYPSD